MKAKGDERYMLGCCDRAVHFNDSQFGIDYNFQEKHWHLVYDNEYKSEAINFCPFCGKKLLQDPNE